MKKYVLRLLAGVLIAALLPVGAGAVDMLVPVGRVVGLELRDDTVTVAAFEPDSAGQTAGLATGDRLLSIDGISIRSPADVRQALEKSQGSVQITVARGETLKTVRAEPAITRDGPKLGVYLRQGVTGIGTVTWYDPDTGRFAALGHGVNDAAGNLLQLRQGSVYPARVASVKKGNVGQPGQLMGALTECAPLGALEKNTLQGVFGKVAVPFVGEPMPVAKPDQVKCGPATILSTVKVGEPQHYAVEIVKISTAPTRTGRNLLLRITDPTLLETTNGIVQGMGVSYNKDNQVNP